MLAMEQVLHSMYLLHLLAPPLSSLPPHTTCSHDARYRARSRVQLACPAAPLHTFPLLLPSISHLQP